VLSVFRDRKQAEQWLGLGSGQGQSGTLEG